MVKWPYEQYKVFSYQQVQAFENLQALGLLSLLNNLKYNTDSFMVVYNCCCYDVIIIFIIIIIEVNISVFGALITVF
jgi:hypothetical protein